MGMPNHDQQIEPLALGRHTERGLMAQCSFVEFNDGGLGGGEAGNIWLFEDQKHPLIQLVMAIPLLYKGLDEIFYKLL